MNFQNVDWWHAAGIAVVAGVAAPVLLPALGLAGVAGALGLAGASVGVIAGAASVVGQAKGAAAK